MMNILKLQPSNCFLTLDRGSFNFVPFYFINFGWDLFFRGLINRHLCVVQVPAKVPSKFFPRVQSASEVHKNFKSVAPSGINFKKLFFFIADAEV